MKHGARRPTLAVMKLASCDGCQLSLLDCEDELLQVADAITIASFPEASSTLIDGPYDLVLVEGSVSTPEDAVRIRAIRSQAKKLVTIGACATAGGIQALRNFADVHTFQSLVYASRPYVEALATSTAIAAHVPVDFELRGCPVDKHQLLEVISAFLAGRAPTVPAHAVCLDCKMKGNVCVIVAKNEPCLGPVTHTGCGAICPTFSRGCYGCFGPSEAPNLDAMTRGLEAQGLGRSERLRIFRTFNADAPAFREAAETRDE